MVKFAGGALLGTQLLAVGVAATTSCYSLPSDNSWPNTTAWSQLNTTVNGQLIGTVPIGSVCHEPNYDADLCAELQDDWTLPQTHLKSSSSVMEPYFANRSCDPFTDTSSACQMGNYVSYAVNVTGADDIVATITFAKENNVHLVIRNTGHDFLGRSTGAGGLAIWTRHLRDISTLTWSDANYTGPAMKMGAGVMGYEAVEAADAAGYVVVGGECPTVGLAGGYTQGGGHSALSTSFGMSADQTLEWEVVTASGELVTASATENSDLFWALSGGGPGNYGVVVSLTVKAYEKATVGGATLSAAAAYTTTENWNKAIAGLHSMLGNITDLGAMVVYYMNSAILEINPVTVFNSTGDYVNTTVLGPFTALMDELEIPYEVSYTTLSYRDHYDTYMGPLPYGNILVEEYQFGSRLIPRSVLDNDNDAFQTVLQNLTANGVLAVGSTANYGKKTGLEHNAVLPAWRDTLVHLQLTTAWNSSAAAWDDMLAAQQVMTDELVPQLEAVTPGSGTYMNEADFNQPDWKENFFGANYDALLAIKNKWDPDSVFYVLKGVGSDSFTLAENGRLCKA